MVIIMAHNNQVWLEVPVEVAVVQNLDELWVVQEQDLVIQVDLELTTQVHQMVGEIMEEVVILDQHMVVVAEAVLLLMEQLLRMVQLVVLVEQDYNIRQ